VTIFQVWLDLANALHEYLRDCKLQRPKQLWRVMEAAAEAGANVDVGS
jgi:hypothetical protein